MEGPELSWGKTPNDLSERWPKAADGTPVKPVFLTDTVETGSAADLIVSKLSAYGIPVMKRYEKDGTLGKVVLGFSGYGVGLYVPETLLEDARALLLPAEDADEGESDN